MKGEDFQGETGRVEFDSNGRRKNMNITILEMNQDGILDVSCNPMLAFWFNFS